MEVTSEMVNAAVSEAVKQKLIPKYAPLDDVVDKWEQIKKIIQAAINESEET